ncbi:MAG: hypothetical protein JSU72_17410, partial [Deltaproteobacteria bacterium]
MTSVSPNDLMTALSGTVQVQSSGTGGRLPCGTAILLAPASLSSNLSSAGYRLHDLATPISKITQASVLPEKPKDAWRDYSQEGGQDEDRKELLQKKRAVSKPRD